MSEPKGEYRVNIDKRYAGNQNARKHEKEMNAQISLRCNKDDKAHWQQIAKSQGVPLNQLILNTMEENYPSDKE